MHTTAQRDAFRFSRKGLTATAAFGPAPAIADDRINAAIDETLAGDSQHPRTTTTREIEDFLVRLFVPGARRAA